MLRSKLLSYRLHKATGQAVVHKGKSHHLGKYSTLGCAAPAAQPGKSLANSGFHQARTWGLSICGKSRQQLKNTF